MSEIVWYFEHSLALPFFGIGMKTPFLWPCWVFQICWHIECSTFTASSFRIWNSSTGILSPQLALFVVMLSKAHLTSHSRMSGSRSVITNSRIDINFEVILEMFPHSVFLNSFKSSTNSIFHSDWFNNIHKMYNMLFCGKEACNRMARKIAISNLCPFIQHTCIFWKQYTLIRWFCRQILILPWRI